MFTAAASSIKVKLYNDGGDEGSVSRPFAQECPILTTCHQDTPQPSGSSTPLDLTSTGIISNKPQKAGLLPFTTPVTLKATGLSVMALAKRESARRGLYSRFFRGPVLGPYVEEPQASEVAQRPSPFRSGLSDPKCGLSITEKQGKKRKSREGDGEIGVAQEKRKSKRETRHRENKRLKKEAEEGGVSELRLDGGAGAGLAKVSTAPENSVQGNGIVDHSRKKNRKKKRKRSEMESTVHHDV